MEGKEIKPANADRRSKGGKAGTDPLFERPPG
jgi:hypothetical protein